MSVPIFVPSFNRPCVRTYEWLKNITLVIHEGQKEMYKDFPGTIMTIPDSLSGNIARVRNRIIDIALSMGFKEYCIMDDDIESVKRWEMIDGDWVQRTLSGEDFFEFIENGFDMAQDWGVFLWGMNCLGEAGAFREYAPFSCKAYISASFHAIRENQLRYDERIPLKEDYDFCLQHLNLFRSTLRFNMYSMVKADHKITGGCQSYRTIEREKEQLAFLQKKWGKHIVKNDLTEKVTAKKSVSFDLNPIIKPPILGI